MNDVLSENLSVEWSDIDGQGLVRVFEPRNFRAGLAIVSMIADVAEEVGYEPTLELTPSKLTVTIAEDDSAGRHTALASGIDALFV